MLEYQEVLRQEQSGNNCVFSAGFVEGHEVDTMYIRLEKDGTEPTILLFRPDEMATIAWLASGVLWSKEASLLTPRAADGPTWRFHHCHTENSHDNANCSNCGKSGRR